MIYLSCPYTHEKADIQEHRYRTSCRATTILLQNDISCFNPLSHSVPLLEHGHCNLTHSQWLKFDLDMLAPCDEVLIIGLENWQKSVGVKEELFEAMALGKPVTLIEKKDIEQLPFIPKAAKHSLKSRILKEVVDGK